MEQPNIVSAAVAKENDGASRRDIVAMLSMLDYLIAQTKPVDAISAHCLVLARQSLEDAAARCVGPH